jgi:hypothetical protein
VAHVVLVGTKLGGLDRDSPSAAGTSVREVASQPSAATRPPGQSRPALVAQTLRSHAGRRPRHPRRRIDPVVEEGLGARPSQGGQKRRNDRAQARAIDELTGTAGLSSFVTVTISEESLASVWPRCSEFTLITSQ